RLSTSAVASDLWLRVPPGGEREVALLLLNAIEPVKEFDAAAAHERSGVAPRQIARLAQELRDRRPSALLGPGAQSNADDAVELAEALLRLNFALGNVGHTVLYSQKPTEDVPSPTNALDGIDVLLLHRARAPVDGVPLVVSFSERLDSIA